MATKSITTPKGTFQYPKFFRPDFKYEEDGLFSGPLTVALDDPKSQEILQTLEAAWKENIADTIKDNIKKGKSPKVEECGDKPWSVDVEANTLTIRAKKKGQFKDKETKELIKTKVAVFGPDLKPLADPGYVFGSGSTGRVTFTIASFYTPKLGAGLTLRLQGVQVLEMKEWERTGESLGFDAVEAAHAAAEEEGDDAPVSSGTPAKKNDF